MILVYFTLRERIPFDIQRK